MAFLNAQAWTVYRSCLRGARDPESDDKYLAVKDRP
jgi:hypothetical protein